MSTKNADQLDLPAAQAALYTFKIEAASEVDVPSSY